MKPVFTDNWVKRAEDHEANWRQWTSHMVIPRILEIGSFEGRSALLWRRIFPAADIHCVDVFGGHHEAVHPGYEARFDANTSRDKRIHKHKGPSREVVPTLPGTFNIVYIDGDHTAEAVYEDAAMTWPRLHLEGVMIFDDYEWYYGPSVPKDGVDKFMQGLAGGYDLLGKGWQVALRRMR